MKVTKEFKLHKLCNKDTLRPALTGVYFDGENLTATNGHALVSVKVETDKNEKAKGIIPAELFNEISKCKLDEPEIHIKGNKAIFKNNGSTIEKELIEEQYPDYEAVLPDPNNKPIMKVSFNINLLKDLCDSLGLNRKNKATNVTLTFTNSNLKDSNDGYLTCDGPIPVSVTNELEDEYRAILMPCRIDR